MKLPAFGFATSLTLALGSGCTRPPPATPVVAAPVTPEPAAPIAPKDEGPAPTPLLSIDWRQVKLESDADAMALWQQIAPTGDDWQLRLGELPDDDGLRKKLAMAMLRAGNVTCRPAGVVTCSGGGGAFGALGGDELAAAETATIDDPCLRRELAMWSLDQLDDTDAASIEAPLVALASLPAPEHALVSEAFDLVPVGADALLLRMVEAAYAAGQGDVADESLHWLPKDALLKLATTLHADGAYRSLDPGEARKAFLAAITDGKLKAATSLGAIDDLLSQDAPKVKKDLRAALVAATKDARCEVAAGAARALVTSGETRFAPKPATGTQAQVIRSLCVMASYVQEDIGDDPALKRFISKRGLQVYDHSEITADPDLPTGGELILPADFVTLPFLEELAVALGHCAGTTCKTTGLRFELGFDPDRTLRKIERFADATACPKT